MKRRRWTVEEQRWRHTRDDGKRGRSTVERAREREREMVEEDSNRCAGGERKRMRWRRNMAHVRGESIVGESE